MNKILIFHEYGEPKHYSGLSELIRINGWKTESYIEFSPIKNFAKSIKKRAPLKAIKALKDLCLLILYFAFPFILRDHIAVIGIAPLDYKLIFMRRILSNCTVIYHSSWLYWDGSKYPKKNCMTIFGFDKYIENSWSKFLKNDVASFAVVTERVAIEIRKRYDILPNKFTIVYHSFDENVYSVNSISEPDNDCFSVVYAGRLIDSKGIDIILKLAESNKNINFSFAGQGVLDKKIIRLSKTLPNIVYHGYVSKPEQLAEIFKTNKIILLPSIRTSTWEELFGIALVEAMACGCIPITTDHYGPSVIFNGTDLNKLCFSEIDYYASANEHIRALLSDFELFSHFRNLSIMTASRFNMHSISCLWKNAIDIALINNKV